MLERQYVRVAGIFLLPVMIASCVIMGDAVVSVVGTLPSGDIDAARECEIRGVYTESSRVFSSRRVSRVFEEDFVVPAGKREYHFEIECPGSGHYQSEVFTLGGRGDAFGRVIDLGKVELQAD